MTSCPRNPHEVAILTLLATLLHGLGYATSRMTVLSAYVGQLLLLRAAFSACGLEKVLISTVDAYQGEENDLILLSLVRSNANGKLGFTSVDNRVCVALSRARLGFFCACNLPMLSQGSELWAKLLSHASASRDSTLSTYNNGTAAAVPEEKEAGNRAASSQRAASPPSTL